jgi:hypothetical protein
MNRDKWAGQTEGRPGFFEDLPATNLPTYLLHDAISPIQQLQKAKKRHRELPDKYSSCVTHRTFGKEGVFKEKICQNQRVSLC